MNAATSESTQSWRELLVEVKRRGLTIAPEIAVGCGSSRGGGGFGAYGGGGYGGEYGWRVRWRLPDHHRRARRRHGPQDQALRLETREGSGRRAFLVWPAPLLREPPRKPQDHPCGHTRRGHSLESTSAAFGCLMFGSVNVGEL